MISYMPPFSSPPNLGLSEKQLEIKVFCINLTVSNAKLGVGKLLAKLYKTSFVQDS